ncbi:MAG: ATP-binding protein [Bryobacterales bacterium]|nr:ATP-binding protein [Bryobacterales bacterium]
MPSFEKSFTLHVPSSTENLALIRDFVGNIGAKAGFDENEINKITLAVDEAVANVIEHAYGSDATREVTIRAVLDADALRFDIIDNGRGFDPGLIKQKDLEQLVKERRSGGLGLRLIRTVMDDVQYQIKPGEKNELRMVKKLKKR